MRVLGKGIINHRNKLLCLMMTTRLVWTTRIFNHMMSSRSLHQLVCGLVCWSYVQWYVRGSRYRNQFASSNRANHSTEIQTCQEGKVDIFTFQTDLLLFYYAMPCAISLQLASPHVRCQTNKSGQWKRWWQGIVQTIAHKVLLHLILGT